MDRLRIAVVAEDPLARAGLGARLADGPLLVLAADLPPAGATPAALAGADAAAWDLGEGETGRLREAAEALPVVVLLPDGGRAGEALEAGARALLPRDASSRQLGAALAAVAGGLFALEPAWAREWVRPGPGRDPAGLLTPRELEVLPLLGEGLSNKGIGARLGIAERTAKFHVESILAKLDAATRAEAVAVAMQRGLLAV